MKEELGQRVDFSGAPEEKQHLCFAMGPDVCEACVHKEQFSSTESKTESFRPKCLLSYSLIIFFFRNLSMNYSYD